MAEGSLKSTVRVSITNFLDSGSIVAGSVGLTMWTKHFGLSTLEVGVLGALSANAFGAALGAVIGGHYLISLADVSFTFMTCWFI